MRQIIRLRSRFMKPDKVYEVDRPEYYHGWPVYSQAFVCPQCTWCWATVGMPPFQIIGVPCVWHPEACHPILRPVAGSLLDNSTFTVGPDLDLLDAMPLELKQREFDLHVAAAERKEDSHVSSNTDTRAGGKPLGRSECSDRGASWDWEDLFDRHAG